ncbi:hypothetical protein ABPG72_015349 [Tetrahymena utriculariae]
MNYSCSDGTVNYLLPQYIFEQKEIWKDINGCYENYEISNTGNAIKINSFNGVKYASDFLKITNHFNGAYQINLNQINCQINQQCPEQIYQIQEDALKLGYDSNSFFSSLTKLQFKQTTFLNQ